MEWAVAENEDEEEWECVACNKTFRSEAAWDSHERSKKHMQAVERLKREMMEEAEELGLEDKDLDADPSDVERAADSEDVGVPSHSPEEPPRSPSPDSEGDQRTSPTGKQDSGPEEEEDNQIELNKPKSKKNKTTRQSRAPSPETLSKSKRRARVRRAPSPGFFGQGEDVGSSMTEPTAGEDISLGKPELSKRDKRRAREAAKKAKEEQEANVPTVSALLSSR